MKQFKIRASQIGKIMGEMGLTEKQKITLAGYEARERGEGKPLTPNMVEELACLRDKRDNAKLPATCTSYLKEWYEEQLYNDREEIKSKYIDKGNACEDSAIDFTAEMFGVYEPVFKNEKFFENDYVCGTPDVIHFGEIWDTKCSWNGETFLEAVVDGLDSDYEWQGRGYMMVTELEVHKVCYCLMDTPDFVNYGRSVSYAHVPNSMRFKSYTVTRDIEKEIEIIERVEKCREWLIEYDKKVMQSLGIG